MRYFISNAQFSVQYITCGNLISRQDFLHQRRTLDEHVLIMVNEGTLYISQDSINYEIGPKQYIFLKAGEEHLGFRPSTKRLSYYWVHFVTKEKVSVFSEKSLMDLMHINEKNGLACNLYIMPEWGEISLTQRVPVLFNQLLDLSRQELLYTNQIIDYALSLLIMEISQEFIDVNYNKSQNISPNVVRIMDWIKANYYKPITITDITNELGYNPDYLSSLFRKTTGYTLIYYINKIRIENSKLLLTNYNITIKEVAYSCGFLDEKYFMKTFKKIEGMTPSQYKKAFTKKNINES